MKNSLYILLLAFLAACTTPDPTTAGLQTYATQNDIALTDYDNVLLIPRQGCGGCISQATAWVIQHADSLEQTRTLVLFNKITDPKLLRNQLGPAYQRPFVAFDRQDIIPVDIYPLDITLTAGQIKATKTATFE